MIFLFYFLLFILGSAVGSFLGVVVDRLSSRESIWKGRSHCDHCRHILGVLDLIPIASFFVLGRKCRYCHKKLSWFYPLIEVSTGVVYVASGYVVFGTYGFLFTQLSYQLLVLYYFLLVGALIAIFFTDLRYGIIPFKAVIFALCVSILWYFSGIHVPGLQINFINIMLSAIGAGGFFFLLFAVTRGRGMGFGDVIYAFLMGFTLGFPGVLLGLYISFVTGAVVALLLVAMKKKKLKGGTIPFGPFLVFGTIVSLLWGNILIAFVLRFLT
jgi:leader peptidase (prepilin peptidase)/N-methyltransferase